MACPPLTVKGVHPTLRHELLWEVTSQDHAFLMHQLVFQKSDGALVHIPIRRGKLTQDLAGHDESWKRWQLLACIAGAADEPELQGALGSALSQMKDAPMDVPEHEELEGKMRAQITLPYVQAISKIAFHFVLARFHFTGFEEEFDDLKRFIYSGTGQNRARIAEEPLLPELVPEEVRLLHWTHILTAEFDPTIFIARMQFFAGPRLKPFTWRVDLGKNPSRVLRELAQGFRFFYYDQPDASGYSGEVKQL